MSASRIGIFRCWLDVRALFHVRVPSPAPLGYDQDQFSTQNWVKQQTPLPSGLNPAFGLKKKQPSVF